MHLSANTYVHRDYVVRSMLLNALSTQQIFFGRDVVQMNSQAVANIWQRTTNLNVAHVCPGKFDLWQCHAVSRSKKYSGKLWESLTWQSLTWSASGFSAEFSFIFQPVRLLFRLLCTEATKGTTEQVEVLYGLPYTCQPQPQAVQLRQATGFHKH